MMLRRIFAAYTDPSCANSSAITAIADDTFLSFTFLAARSGKITAAFDGGRPSSDQGVRLLAAGAWRIAIAARLAVAGGPASRTCSPGYCWRGSSQALAAMRNLMIHQEISTGHVKITKEHLTPEYRVREPDSVQPGSGQRVGTPQDPV